ncbi:MAG: Hsp70 family protein [Anaerovibrio sp.]|nr:Hsp70 family protein [Anaerovibrio sp.]
MKYYVGIDLGTTNSAISSFDGENVRVWKSKKDQNDVTPSAIYVDKRGKRFYGKDAYLKAAQQPERCATLFKRFMGTSTKIKLGDEELTPEECSAEVLRELYKNLPEEIRSSDEVGVVITVPAAFNQMQNAATLEAAKQAGLGKVALMQEPVAAIMSVMKAGSRDGNFLIFDLGGGTLDVAIAESMSGKVNLLAHGGIAMCGGRDFDRVIMNNVVIPWLRSNYQLPDDFRARDEYKKLLRIAAYKAEVAKIELSSDEVVNIEGETGTFDAAGEEIYLDVELQRSTYDALIDELVMEAVRTTRETIEKAGLTPQDIDRIIFVGGPTNYKSLRDKVVLEVGVPVGSIEVNPMTAVSEGASIFAESIDWSNEEHGRKSAREQVESGKSLGLSFRYVARSTAPKAKFAIVLAKPVTGYTFEISSRDTGWHSGSMELKNRATLELELFRRGSNYFHVDVFDASGRPVELESSDIEISYTLATVGAILASHSIGVEVCESSSSDKAVLDYLVREGDALPAKGQKKFRATETIRAGSDEAINFKLWEGDMQEDVEDNRFIGHMTITGRDFDFGMIMAGAEIICNYVVNDSGSIDLEISVPSISESFNSDKNFYSRQGGQLDLDKVADKLNYDGKQLMMRVRNLGENLEDGAYMEQLKKAGEVASQAMNVQQDKSDHEELQQLNDAILKMKKELNKIRRGNLQLLREKTLAHFEESYNDLYKEMANQEEDELYHRMFAAARSRIAQPGNGFEEVIDHIRGLNYEVMAKSDKFIIYDFNCMIDSPEDFEDKQAFEALKQRGMNAVVNENIQALREVVDLLWSIKRREDDSDANGVRSNIVRG